MALPVLRIYWGAETFKLAYFSVIESSSTCVNYKSKTIKTPQKQALEKQNVQTNSAIATNVLFYFPFCFQQQVDEHLQSLQCTITVHSYTSGLQPI